MDVCGHVKDTEKWNLSKQTIYKQQNYQETKGCEAFSLARLDGREI